MDMAATPRAIGDIVTQTHLALMRSGDIVTHVTTLRIDGHDVHGNAVGEVLSSTDPRMTVGAHTFIALNAH